MSSDSSQTFIPALSFILHHDGFMSPQYRSLQTGWGGGSDSVSSSFNVSCFIVNQDFKGVVGLNAALFTPVFPLLSFQ